MQERMQGNHAYAKLAVDNEGKPSLRRGEEENVLTASIICEQYLHSC